MFQRRDFVCLLLLCWLGYRLFPYAPVIDLHKYWAAVRALALTSNISTVDIYRHAVTWLAVSVLLEALVGTTYVRFVVIPLLGAVLFFRIVADEVFLSLPEVAGGVIGVLLWIFVLWRVQHRTIIIAGLFVGLVILQALAPFQFIDTGRSFGWMPFRSLLNNSNANGIAPFFEKIFTYGCLVWLLGRAGCSWLAATISGAILVFVLRLMQVYLPGRSAEITDVILLLSAAIAMKVMAEDPRSQRA
jgi:hypothetical protein